MVRLKHTSPLERETCKCRLFAIMSVNMFAMFEFHGDVSCLIFDTLLGLSLGSVVIQKTVLAINKWQFYLFQKFIDFLLGFTMILTRM